MKIKIKDYNNENDEYLNDQDDLDDEENAIYLVGSIGNYDDKFY